jgi:hypothetical protein
VQLLPGDLRPNGSVSVRVSCTTNLTGLTVGDIATKQTMSATATEAIDRYRGTG